MACLVGLACGSTNPTLLPSRPVLRRMGQATARPTAPAVEFWWASPAARPSLPDYPTPLASDYALRNHLLVRYSKGSAFPGSSFECWQDATEARQP